MEDINKALFGYDPSDVEGEMDLLSIEFERISAKQKEELLLLTKENEKLKQELTLLKSQLKPFIDRKNKIEKGLYDSYIEACIMMHDRAKVFDTMIENKTKVLAAQQSKNQSMKSSLDTLLWKLSQMNVD